MKTELLFWDKYFPKMAKRPIDRLLYGVHAYRLELNVICGGCLRKGRGGRSRSNFDSQLARTKRYYTYFVPGPATNSIHVKKDPVPDHKLLLKLYNMLEKYEATTKVRVTGSWSMKTGDSVFISSNELNVLEEIAGLFKSKSRRKQVLSLSFPENEKSHDAIKTGAILRKTQPKYKFQISLSNRKMTRRNISWEERQRIHTNVLEHLLLLETVYVPETVQYRLKNGSPLRGAIIFTDDPANLGFISLIDPYILGKISPVLCVSDK